ncbi:hypothetical protein Mapa_001981 [Marchantia paleacea]|nr:hypothetical protein Mapa_001981 [Marchantia paleacea]
MIHSSAKSRTGMCSLLKMQFFLNAIGSSPPEGGMTIQIRALAQYKSQTPALMDRRTAAASCCYDPFYANAGLTVRSCCPEQV